MANFTPQEIEQFLQEFFDVVGTRQYTGARYIPIFGRKNESTVEWDNLAPYEPLTVVMHQGVSYVSKQYVPKDVDITDTNYWAETYRFNAQVEQYRQEVLQFQSQIDQIQDTMESDYVPFPDSDHYPKYGTLGQVLTTLADGETKWENPVVPSDAQAETVITAWLNEHPEATTTVQDNSLTTAKYRDSSVTDAKLAQSGGVLSRVDSFLTNSILLNTFVGIGLENKAPTITHSSNDVTVSFPTGDVDIRVNTVNASTGEKTRYLVKCENPGNITLNHGKYLVCDFTPTAQSGYVEGFSAVSYSDLSGNANLIVCFMNAYGSIVGPWKSYDNQSKIKANETALANKAPLKLAMTDRTMKSCVGVAVEGYPPTLTHSGQNVVVSIPRETVVVRAITNNETTGAKAMPTTTWTNTGDITVAHSECLVFDVTSTGEGTLVEGFKSVAYSDVGSNPNYIMCFYNSYGAVIGYWKVYDNQTLISNNTSRIAALEDALPIGLPSYYDSYMETKVDEVNTAFSSGEDTITFAFVTDMHFPANEKWSPDLIKLLHEKCNLDMVVLGGDFITTTSTKMSAISGANDVCAQYEGNWDTYRLVGNHEYNNPGDDHPEKQLTATELQHSIIAGSHHLIDYQSGGCSYIVKDPIRNACYIMLDCGYDSVISTATTTWFAETLRDSIPTNATIILCAHRIFNNVADTPVSSAMPIINTLDAYNARTTITVDGTTYDYSTATGRVALVMSGHTHMDKSYVTSGGVPCYCTTCDSTRESGSLDRTTGTTNEQAFDVVALDNATKTVNLIRIGAGSNRSYTWT